jgi:Na+/H+ antiporter NhaD/arsenite permease-like protein
MASVLFFLGILSAVSALQSAGILGNLAMYLDSHLRNPSLEVVIIGIVSAIVDNVPLVAAAMGMYDLTQFALDSSFWTGLAFCAGTGGSILVIGSAAGVAAMSLVKIDFMWYLKRIAPLALLGYFAGAISYFFIFK